MLIYSAVFPNDRELKPESIVAKWKEITTFGVSRLPDCPQRGLHTVLHFQMLGFAYEGRWSRYPPVFWSRSPRADHGQL